MRDEDGGGEDGGGGGSCLAESSAKRIVTSAAISNTGPGWRSVCGGASSGSGGFERWMEGERTSLARDHATALERLARRAEEQKNDPAAVDWWRRLASLDPLDGKTTLRLMEALVRAGDRVGALKQARIYEVLLSQELELPPDRDVIALAERIRAMESAPSAPTPIAAARSSHCPSIRPRRRGPHTSPAAR